MNYDAAPFSHLGCRPRGNGAFNCGDSSVPGKLGCDRLFATHLLGGLKPSEPIAQCYATTMQGSPAPDGYIRRGEEIFFLLEADQVLK